MMKRYDETKELKLKCIESYFSYKNTKQIFVQTAIHDPNQKSQLTDTSQSAKKSVFHNSREYKLNK
jgi:hypothetical protein